MDLFTAIISSGVTAGILTTVISTFICRHYENKLNIELEKVKTANQGKLYVTQKQYDMELDIYQNIWEKLNSCVNQTGLLYPQGISYRVHKSNIEEYIEQSKAQFEEFASAYNAYSTYIDSKAPFIKKEFYDEFLRIRGICSRVGSIFQDEEIMKYTSPSYMLVRDEPMEKEDRDYVYREYPKEIAELRSKLVISTREYLESLRITDNS